MDVLILLNDAHYAGLKLRIDGDLLRVTGPNDADDIARRLGANKMEVMHQLGTNWPATAERLLAQVANGDLRSDLRDIFDETVAFLQYEKGNVRAVAEYLAYGTLIAAMLERGIDIEPVAELPQNRLHIGKDDT